MQDKVKSLTARSIESLKKEGYHRDGGARGLYVQVAWREHNGVRSPEHGVTCSWVFRSTSPATKRVRMMGLGGRAIHHALAEACRVDQLEWRY